MQMTSIITGNPFDREYSCPALDLLLFEQDSQPAAFELAFEDEDTGLTHRFACDEDGQPLSTSRDLVEAIDNFRFVGMFGRNGGQA